MNVQNEERKNSNSRIVRFIDEQSTYIREILELENKDREEQGR